MPNPDDNMPPLVRELAERLLPHVDDISEGMAQQLHAEISELAADRAPMLSETVASCRSNVGQILRGLTFGEAVDRLVTPPEALEYARSYVRRELPLAVLLRAYRIGQAYFLRRWAGEMANQAGDDPRRLGESMVASTAWVFAYIDHVCNELVTEYGRTLDGWAHSPDAIRAETVRRILDGTLRDEAEAGRMLGYELHRRHHLGLVVWRSVSEVPGFARISERVAHAAADAVGMSEPLMVLPGGSERWVWCSGLEAPPDHHSAALAALELPPGVQLAAGRVRRDINGFARSHLEATAAARVVVLANGRGAAVTQYDEVELVSLLAADLERARGFVRDELRRLAEPAPQIERLRETVLVLLQEGMSNSRAAARLYVHHNTVVYRTARAQELLGHRISERRIQLTAALMLAQTLGATVLGPAEVK